MTIPAPQGSIPFVDQDRTPSNSAMIFLQQLRNAVNSLSGGSGGSGSSPSAFPLKAPDGSAAAPSYSWLNDTASGWYRFGFQNYRYSINGNDVVALAPYLLQMGSPNGAVLSNFYYPTDINGQPATGFTIKINRLMVGLETTFSSAGNRSTLPWNSNYLNGDADVFASVAVISQVGGYPIVGSTRTSDFRTAYGSQSNGSGTYFLAVNDDTTGNPIAAGCNPTSWRASGVGGVTESCQCDVTNAGSVVDIDAHLGFQAGTTIGNNITCGAFNASSAKASAAITFDHVGTGGFRKGLVVTNSTLDSSVGVFGGGILINTPIGASWQWINASSGATIAEFGATTNGCGPIGALKAGSVGIWPGIGDGGTVTQLTSINTAVTLNTICGQITTVSNAWTSGFGNGQAFIVNNTTVAASDVVVVNTSGGTGNYNCFVSKVASNSFQISIIPYTSQTEAVTINFMVFKNTTT